MFRLALESLWYQEPSAVRHRILDACMAPLSWIYRSVQVASTWGLRPKSLGRPVISVGNLTVGGSGKTPLVVELVCMLAKLGRRVAVISRGYGRQGRGVRIVRAPGRPPLPVAYAGDEPLLIAHRCPQAAVVVGEDRVKAGKLAVDEFAPEVIVFDDAFQHRRLHRDLDVLAIHAQRGFGNRRLLPRGPLRELPRAIRRAQLVIFTYAGNQSIVDLRRRYNIPESTPAACLDFIPTGLTCAPMLKPTGLAPGLPVLAVCGVANPAGFISGCRLVGLRVEGQMVFPDHHSFTQRDLVRIQKRAMQQEIQAIVTTEKDLTRIPAGSRLSVFGLRIEASWKNEDCKAMVESLLKNQLSD